MSASWNEPVQLSTVSTSKIESEKPNLVKKTSEIQIRNLYLSEPKKIEFPTADGTAWMYYYPPKNSKYSAPTGQLPPLLVKSHGGPTAAASSVLNVGIQYWTSRGYAIADIDYRGSSGYGRAYRDKLKGQWGIADVEDCCAAAEYLADKGLVDREKMCIDGGSAGGYTTLACLAFKDTFKAGASAYGIGDLETLARDTHKFESRYLDSLIGRYPEDKEIYKQRSPINFVDGFNCPIIFFQGEDDRVVPLNQAESMHAAVKEKGVLCSIVVFPGEGHGFRKAPNQRRALDGELFFFNTVFGLQASMPEDLDTIDLDNFDPFLPGEARAYIVVDGVELELGRESGVIRQVGFEPVPPEAYFPEERPDRPSGSGAQGIGGDEKKELKIDDVVEWL